MKTKKIGEVNFKDFKTEFFLTQRVKDYLKKEKTSLACLLPEGWLWYEVILFDLIDKNRDGIPDEKFGKNFRVIYNGIIDKRGLKKDKIFEKRFAEEIAYPKEEFLTTGNFGIKSPIGKEYFVKYIILKNMEKK